jgi:hypothetical protein
MEGIIDDEPTNNPTAGAQGGQPGPFGDIISQFQQNRSGAGTAGYGGYAPQQQQQQYQQPAMDWGSGFAAAQQAAYANMTGYGAGLDSAAGAGGDMDADGGYAKRQRMGDQAMMAAMGGGAGPHASSSSNQLQALGNPSAGWQQQAGNQLVEGTDLTQVYEAARAAQQHQQFQHQQGAAYAAQGYAGYGAGLMDNGYAETPINQVGPSDIQQQMMMQHQQQMQPNYNMSATGGRARMERANQSSRLPAVSQAAQGPSRLTTGHKHAEYLQNLVRARFNTGAAAGSGAGGMVTRSATNQHYGGQQHGMQQYPGYYQYGMQHQEEDHAAEEADQVLSKCEAVSGAECIGSFNCSQQLFSDVQPARLRCIAARPQFTAGGCISSSVRGVQIRRHSFQPACGL